jgi:hypothetical protein
LSSDLVVVHGKGLEPLRLAAAEPKFKAPESTSRTAAILDEFDGTERVNEFETVAERV